MEAVAQELSAYISSIIELPAAQQPAWTLVPESSPNLVTSQQ